MPAQLPDGTLKGAQEYQAKYCITCGFFQGQSATAVGSETSSLEMTFSGAVCIAGIIYYCVPQYYTEGHILICLLVLFLKKVKLIKIICYI